MKCGICGKEFELSVTKHYISRDEEIQRCDIVGIVGNNTDKESKLYDAFDCPFCGCQVIAQERKRVWLDKPLDSIEENDYNDSADIENKCSTSSCFGLFNRCKSPYCSKWEECKSHTEGVISENEDYDCLGNYDEHSEGCNQCSFLDECVARSEANEVRND